MSRPIDAEEVRVHVRRHDLDGVRGIAILLVLLGHALAGPMAATGILLKEFRRFGQIDLRKFYARRFTRLAPPLALVVLVTLLLAGGIPLDSVVAPLTWTTNYARLLGFDVDLLEHTWSPAVEEQFCLVWPLALAALLSRREPVRLAVGLVDTCFGVAARTPRHGSQGLRLLGVRDGRFYDPGRMLSRHDRLAVPQ